MQTTNNSSFIVVAYVPFSILIDFYFDFDFEIVEGNRIHIQV